MQEFRTKHSQIKENIRKNIRWKRKIVLNIRKNSHAGLSYSAVINITKG